MPSRSRPAMQRFCERADHLQPTWGTSTRALRPAATPSCSTRSLAKAIRCLAVRCMRPVAMGRRLPPLRKSSVLTPPTRTPTCGGGSRTMGSGICRARALHARPSRIIGEINIAWQSPTTASAGTRMRKPNLRKMKAAFGDTAAYQYAAIYAQWRNQAKALEWLETALRVRDPGLELLKTDPLLDPLRNEPRFRAIERELKFPS